jgi:hypothetical protein
MNNLDDSVIDLCDENSTESLSGGKRPRSFTEETKVENEKKPKTDRYDGEWNDNKKNGIRMAEECLPGLMVMDMMASGRMTRSMAEECIPGLMVMDMRVSGRMTRRMAEGCLPGLVVNDMRVSSRIIVGMVEEY